MNLKNVNDTFNCQSVLQVPRVYSSRDLLSGTASAIKWDSFDVFKRIEKRFNWATFLVSYKGKIVYVETTRSLLRRIKDLAKTKEWIKSDTSRVLISVQYGEDFFLKLYKPIYNNGIYIGTKRESSLMCFGNKLKEIRTLHELEGYSNYIPNSTRDDQMLHTQSPLNTTWCYNVTEGNTCACEIPCKVRQWWNDMYNKMYPEKTRPRWHPLSTSDLKKEYQTRGDKFIPSTTSTLELSRDFIDNIIESLSGKENTIKGYKKILHALISNDILQYIIYPERFTKYLLKRYSKVSVKQQVLVIKILLDNIPNDTKHMIPEYSNLLESFNDIYRDLSASVNEASFLQEKNSKQEENWTSWESLIKVLSDLHDIVRDDVEHPKYQEYLGIKLLLEQQSTRNDYSTLLHQNYNPETSNYINLEKNEIVWNDYKTVSTHGQVHVPIKDPLKEPIKQFTLKRRRESKDHIFETKNGTQMNKDNFGGMIRQVFKRHLGKNIGVQMIRVIKVSEARRNELTLRQEKELAQDLMHSSSISRAVYRKIL